MVIRDSFLTSIENGIEVVVLAIANSRIFEQTEDRGVRQGGFVNLVPLYQPVVLQWDKASNIQKAQDQ